MFYAQVHSVVGDGFEGKRLFVRSVISAEDIIIEYRGTRASNAEAYKREATHRARGSKQEYILYVHEIDKVLYATLQRNCARFANHHCSPNSKEYTVRLPNSRILVVFLYAIFRLAPDEEVYVDYRWSCRGSYVLQIFCCSSFHCNRTV